jgi:dimethylglycine dehydrogenase
VAGIDPRQQDPEENGPHRALPPADTAGGVRAEFTVYEWQPGRFYLVSAGAYERHDHDYLQKLCPTDGSVRLNPITTRLGVLVIAGPNSRKLLQKLTSTDLSNEAFPWLSGKQISVGPVSTHCLRVNFVGELGYEFHHPIEQQVALFDLLMEAGKEFGIRPYGIKAMSSLSIEKSYRLVPRELSIEYSAYESALDRFVHPSKGPFIGRDALVAGREKGLNWNFVTMEVHGVTDTDSDARGSEPVYANGKLVGRATNGGFGFRCNKSLALAMVKPEHAALGTELEIKILGSSCSRPRSLPKAPTIRKTSGSAPEGSTPGEEQGHAADHQTRPGPSTGGGSFLCGEPEEWKHHRRRRG